MELRFLDRGTELTIESVTYDNEPVNEYTAKYYDVMGYTTIMVECDELYNDFIKNQKFNDDLHLKVTFSRGTNFYTFKGKVKSTIFDRLAHLVLINQMSEVTASTRRTYPRLDITVAVTVYDKAFGRLICGDTLDISAEGLCLLSNTELPSDIDEYVLEFSLTTFEKFIMPSKLVRRGDNPQIIRYSYDYGFLFDYSQNEDDKARLVTALFMHKMKNL